MKPIEQVEASALDRAVVAILKNRAPDREYVLSTRLAASPEVFEFVALMQTEFLHRWNIAPVHVHALGPMLLTAMSIGLEIGYELGAQEMRKV